MFIFNRQFEILTANLRAGMQLTRYNLRHCRMVTCTFNFFPSFSDDSNKEVNKMIIRNALAVYLKTMTPLW